MTTKGMKEYYQRNKELIKKRVSLWYQNHRESMFVDRNCWICGVSLKETSCRRFCYACTEKNKNIRYKLKMEIRNSKRYLLKILGGKCFKCSITKNLNIHHKKRENKLKDLMLLCEKCHREEEIKVSKSVPVFKGDLTKEIKKFLSCEICGRRKFILIHYKDNNPKNNRDTTNIQLVCKRCHYKIHHNLTEGVKVYQNEKRNKGKT
jgi:Zn finger protein HypA/HybF involved in hydrogenase expression